MTQSYKYCIGKYITEGPETTYRIYHGKCWQTLQYIKKLKKNKTVNNFPFFKHHLKKQEHQINTLPHEYGKKTDIKDV